MKFAKFILSFYTEKVNCLSLKTIFINYLYICVIFIVNFFNIKRIVSAFASVRFLFIYILINFYFIPLYIDFVQLLSLFYASEHLMYFVNYIVPFKSFNFKIVINIFTFYFILWTFLRRSHILRIVAQSTFCSMKLTFCDIARY